MVFPKTARILLAIYCQRFEHSRELASASCEGAIYSFHFFERFTSRYEENQTNSTAGEEESFALSLLYLTVFNVRRICSRPRQPYCFENISFWDDTF